MNACLIEKEELAVSLGLYTYGRSCQAVATRRRSLCSVDEDRRVPANPLAYPAACVDTQIYADPMTGN